MTIEELIRKLQAYPPDMVVKIVTITVDDVVSVTQDGEDYVKLGAG